MIEVRPLGDVDRAAAGDLWQAHWGGTLAVSRGVVHDLAQLEGLVAVDDGVFAGAATVNIAGGECEVVSIDAVEPGRGAGTALLEAAAGLARSRGCRRLWLITTNDNLRALRMYQRRGLRLAALHPGALDRTRELKPWVPEIGADGIPLRDELELEMSLDG